MILGCRALPVALWSPRTERSYSPIQYPARLRNFSALQLVLQFPLVRATWGWQEVQSDSNGPWHCLQAGWHSGDKEESGLELATLHSNTRSSKYIPQGSNQLFFKIYLFVCGAVNWNQALVYARHLFEIRSRQIVQAIISNLESSCLVSQIPWRQGHAISIRS